MIAPSRSFCRIAALALGLQVLTVSALGPAPAASCPAHALLREVEQLDPGPDGDELVLSADQLRMDAGGSSRLAGGVRIHQDGQSFTTESLSFDRNTRVARIEGESLFRNDNIVVRSRKAEFNLEQRAGSFDGSEFALPAGAARGSAERLSLSADAEAQLDGASYTTCPESAEAWLLQASRIRMDYAEGYGSARNARLRFMGVPIVYLPYFQFPIDDRRRTGLLYPTIGSASNSGLDFRWPVYLNLAPNYDATLTPRYLSDRGLQAGTEFRYLLDQHEGDAQFEYIDDREFGDDRTLFRFSHRGLMSDRISVAATYSEISDRDYFEDLGGSLASVSTTHLEQTAVFVYQAPAAYTVRALFQDFQPIASNLTGVDDPYKRLPQVRFDALTRNSFLGTRAGMGAEFVNFSRENSVEGARLILEPYLRYRQEYAHRYVQGQADLHFTQYDLSGVGTGADDQYSRTLPVVSAEAGLRYERVTQAGKLQTLTPRVIALYVPYVGQDELPLFDTGAPDFDFVQLFARNRFSGEDRIADARQIAGQVTLRELDPETGQSRWSATAGQIYRVSTPRVTIPTEPAPERGATEFVGEVTYRLFENWQSVLASQWSPEDNRFARTQAGIRYLGPHGNRQFNLSYRYRRDLIEQADISFLTPIWGSWALAGRTRYSLRDSTSRENFVGLEYRTCCWAVRTSWRRYIANESGDFDSGFYIQLQLAGLANIGSGEESLLPNEELESEYRR